MLKRGLYIGPGQGVPKPPPPPVPPKSNHKTVISLGGLADTAPFIRDSSGPQVNGRAHVTQPRKGSLDAMGVVGTTNGRPVNGHASPRGHPSPPGRSASDSRLCRMMNGYVGHSESGVTDGEEDHQFHRFSSDVLNPDSATPARIYGARGSVRGHKNRVRAGIAVLTEKSDGNKNYRELDKGKIVVFTTSVQIVRFTYERCTRVRSILQTHMLEFEERDVFLSKENQQDLMERLKMDRVVVPQVFADGQHLGGADELEDLNESGQLKTVFKQYKRISQPTKCDKCGGYKYLPCITCHGSKKSLRRNNFTNELCALRCVACDENGLIRCDWCLNQQRR